MTLRLPAFFRRSSSRLVPFGFLVAGWLASSPWANAQAPAKQWDKRFGGSGSDVFYLMKPTSDGGYLLAGDSDSPVGGDQTQASRGRDDYWLVKTDANGTKQWDKRYGGSQDDYINLVQPTSDGGYLLGGRSNSPADGDKTEPSRGSMDYWLVKIDANGTKQWDKVIGGSGRDFLATLQPTSDGGYLLAGSSNSTAGGDKTEPSRGENDYWLVKIDANGRKQWDKTLGGSDHDDLSTLVPTSDGGYLLAGSSLSPAGGDKTEPGRGGTDYWVVKIDASGRTQWDKALGGSSLEVLEALQATSDGGYLLGGLSMSPADGDKTELCRGVSDYWLVKINASGAKQWDQTLGGSESDVLSALLPTNDGGYLLGGHSFSPADGDKTEPGRGGADYWLVKLAPLAPTASPAPAGVRQTLDVYPNPARQRLRLRLPAEAPRTGLRLSLLDATGRLVRQQPLTPAGADVTMPVGAQPAGLYLLRLEGPGGYVATQRVLLE